MTPPPVERRSGGTALLAGGIALSAVATLVVAALLGLLVARDGGAGADRPADASQLAGVGATAADAGCDDVVADPGRGISTHVGPGTVRADTDRVDYDQVPPSTGPHFVSPVYPAAEFYPVADGPRVENLVHNLEHGYTVLWYDPALPADQVDDLREIARLARQSPSTAGKFIVTPWDGSYGAFPAGRSLGLSHWTALDGGRRQLCAAPSGEVVEAFVESFPFSDSPEPNGA